MKKRNLLLGMLILAGSVQAQVVGDGSVQSVGFDNNSLFFAGTAQADPKVLISGGYSSVIWGTDVAPNILKHSILDANYQGTTNDNIMSTSGDLNTLSQDLHHAVCLDTLTGKMLSVYKHNLNDPNPALDDFSMKGVLYTDNNFTGMPFNIEGPFGFSSDAPSNPSISVSSNSIFCVAYHSSLTMGSSSEIRVKFVDANTGVVTPAASGAGQNGISLTFPGAQHPSVAWNETAGVFGIVYTVGSGNNQKIKYVSVDEAGTIVTSQKDVVADNSIQVQFPEIYADGSNFVMTWRDYRQITIAPHPPVTGIPSVRIAQLDASGDLISLTGAADIFDSADNSLLISNPYFTEQNLFSDLEVIQEGSQYAVVWGTQNVVPSIEFGLVEVSGGAIKSSVAIDLQQDGVNSFSPSLAYDQSTANYVVTYHEFNGTTYENRVCKGQECTLMASLSGTDVTSFGGSDGSITASASGTTGTIDYAWSSGGSSATETGLTAGTYSVVITDDSGCETYLEYIIDQPADPSGISENSNLKISVYPNPTSEFISVSGDIENSFVELINVEGQKVKGFYLFDSKSAQLFVDDLDSGVYFLSVKNDIGESTVRVILE